MARPPRTWLLGFSALIVLGTAACSIAPEPKPEVKTMDAEELWCEEQRAVVTAYLKREKVDHGEVGEWPAWHVDPYVSIWAIESKKAPGWVGWWVIAGDLPTDYVSSATIKHPREAMRAIAERWAKLIEDIEAGREVEDFTIGEPEDWPELMPLLRARVTILRQYVANEDIWPE